MVFWSYLKKKLGEGQFLFLKLTKKTIRIYPFLEQNRTIFEGDRFNWNGDIVNASFLNIRIDTFNFELNYRLGTTLSSIFQFEMR